MTTSISNAYQATNIHLNNIIPLDFVSVLQLPESHVWTDDDDSGKDRRTCLVRQPRAVAASPPVIDLQAPDAVGLVGDACRTWGVFQVTNHGVPHDLLEGVEDHVRRLFELPNDQKLKALRAPNGVTGYGVPRFSPFFPKLMWHEGFTIAGSPMEHAKLLWPHHYEEFCDAIDEYQKKMKSLAYNILLVMLKALGVDEEDREKLSSSFFNQSDSALQLNSYPSCPDPSQAMGLAPHTDTLLVTILHHNNTDGLQIMQEGVGWVPVRPIPGALVVNIGDLMHILSNATFYNMYHRVVPNETSHRFTMAYFYGLPADSVLAPLPKLPGPPRFRTVTVKEYIGLKNKHNQKALSFIQI
ncbi:gibberellin 3-beta-dioxygenase 1-like [Salvia hispanica]|uniref:gibberellin 3-beta-dioxygenase 1-like n=1 Tax=Salvia hispanica TaxID=49212 RepID=UPI002009B296|nr:gibberellin 3-beta-dioxygenase 1-like [Salvia hispanica]